LTDTTQSSNVSKSRALTIGLTALAVLLGTVLVIVVISRSAAPAEIEPVNVLANSNNDCVECHSRTTPGIVDQYGHSTMAAAEVTCQDCHQVTAGYPGAIQHEGVYVLNTPTTAMCQDCHEPEVNQFYASRHSLPSYVAYAGTENLSFDLFDIYNAIPEIDDMPDRSRNQLYHLEGPDITRFACEGCHNIGQPKPDGSVGECQQCHLRHAI